MFSTKNKKEEDSVSLFDYKDEVSEKYMVKFEIVKSYNFRQFLNLKSLLYTLFLLSVLVFIIFHASSNWQNIEAFNYSEYFFDNSTNDTKEENLVDIEFKDNCSFPVFDPWDEAIKPFVIEPVKTKNCDRNRKPYTELVNGTWRVVQEKEGRVCKARCHVLPDLTKPINVFNWIPPGPVDCEFLEAVCWDNKVPVYGYIHTQIIPKLDKLPKPKIHNDDHPDVFVFLMDSLSSGMAKRSLPKTTEYMRNTLKSVDFPYLSQVGTRSQVNAVPLWFGKQVEAGSMRGGKRIEVDWTEEEYCNRYLDDEPNMFKDFQEAGYTTAYMDNWFAQALTHNPDCKGFQHFYTNHTLYPLTYINERTGEFVTKQSLKGQSSCRELYLAAQEYFDQFVRAYPDRPKFTWNWFVQLAHDDLAGPNRGDTPFLEFFRRNFEMFDNAFVIFMADHGFRTGTYKLYSTPIGTFEKYNPFLSVSVPKKYRNNGILEVMQQNAKRLQTHYDVRAMLLDILKYQPSSNFKDRSVLKMPDEKGNSLIRRQPDFPRNCQHLPIPQQYCYCQSNSTDLLSNTQLTDRLSKALLNHVQKKLDDYKLSSLCHRFKTQVVIELDRHESSANNKTTYHISLKTDSPAHLETLITENEITKELEIDEISRLDRYGTTADCSKSIHFTPLCYCRRR